MEIKVKCSCGEGKCPEWAIVELQGVVEAQSSFQDCLQNLQIGVLCRPSSQVFPSSLSPDFDSLSPSVFIDLVMKWFFLLLLSKENYTLTVGYHELMGAKVPLKKPMLVLKKLKVPDEEEKDGDSSSSSRVEMDVIGIIRHKILFKTRPKALISSKFWLKP